MSPKRSWFNSFKEINGGEVVMGKNIAYRVEGIGDVILKFENGYIFTL